MTNPHAVQEKLERRILHGLASEWEAALWVLRPKHRALMKQPLFRLGDLTHTWGYWSGDKNEICLSRLLVLNHPWDAVREVLLHEMAHQFAHQILEAQNEPPHGPAFMRACTFLRANAKASGTYPPLQERVYNGALSADDKILIWIKKLLALAESQNRHEAEAAMMKAHKLIAKYNIDLISFERKRHYVSVFLGKPCHRHQRNAKHLARLIQDFYYVHGIWVPAYVTEKGKMGRVLEVSGTRQNIAIAGYVYDFVQRFIQSQWASYNTNRKLDRYRKIDYAVGIIEGFREKLTAQRNTYKTARHRLELITVDDLQLNDYMAHKYPHTRSFRRAVSNQDESVIRDGVKAGKKLVISRGISETHTGNIHVIEAPK